jgi:hypothetical protein
MGRACALALARIPRGCLCSVCPARQRDLYERRTRLFHRVLLDTIGHHPAQRCPLGAGLDGDWLLDARRGCQSFLRWREVRHGRLDTLNRRRMPSDGILVRPSRVLAAGCGGLIAHRVQA